MAASDDIAEVRPSGYARSNRSLADVRTLIVGASSGIGRALAVAAHAQGARVALAARRTNLLVPLAGRLQGFAHELDVSDPCAIEAVVSSVAAELGGLDALVITSAVVPFAHIEDTDFTTWMHAFAVNAVGATHLVRAALPHLSPGAVILIASADELDRPRAGVAAYSASKAALDEITRSWRAEHPELAVIRVNLGPTRDTEILRGADRDLLSELYSAWALRGQIPAEMSNVLDVANTLVALVAAARRNRSVVPEVVHLAPRSRASE